LALSLKAGAEPAFLSCGAYKATHSSAALNGFVPLKVRCI
jgi:hypothetical protein